MISDSRTDRPDPDDDDEMPPTVSDRAGLHVMAEQCSTCIFRAGNRMSLRRGRVREMTTHDGSERHERAFRRRAHAHTAASNAHRGAICFLSADRGRAVTATGAPTTLLAHEFAHIATWQGHSKKWAAVLTTLGFPAEAKRCTTRRTRWTRVSEVEYGDLTEDQRRVLRHAMLVSKDGTREFRYYRAVA